jgi:TPR repeat protein
MATTHHPARLVACFLVVAGLASACSERRRLEKACATGDTQACSDLEQLHEKSCVGGDRESCASLAALLRKPCEEGVEKSCSRLQQLLMKMCLDRDPKAPPTHLEGMAKNLAACQEGVDLQSKIPGYILAARQRACEGGAAADCYELGRMYYEGRGAVSKEDKTLAAQSWRQACQGGHGQGCFKLGKMLSDGDGVARDNAAAVRLYQKACAAESGWGCLELVAAYGYFGSLGQPNEALQEEYGQKALRLLDQACQDGDAESCLGLFQVAASGALAFTWPGAPPPDEARAAQLCQRAAELFRQACEGGDDTACRTARELQCD